MTRDAASRPPGKRKARQSAGTLPGEFFQINPSWTGRSMHTKMHAVPIIATCKFFAWGNVRPGEGGPDRIHRWPESLTL